MGTVSELTEEHTNFLVGLVDSYSTTTISGMHELLLEQFPEISASKSALYGHIRVNCTLSMKKLENLNSKKFGGNPEKEKGCCSPVIC